MMDKSWIIASTSTTDWNGRDPVEVYPIYLLPEDKRTRAWWSRSLYLAKKYETPEAAEKAIELLGLNRDYVTAVVIHDAGSDHVTAIKAARKAKKEEA